MTPDEQAERDQIAFALDILLSITASHLQRVEQPVETLSHRLTERRTLDPVWVKLWRRDAVA